jgi:hypothetical protein
MKEVAPIRWSRKGRAKRIEDRGQAHVFGFPGLLIARELFAGDAAFPLRQVAEKLQSFLQGLKPDAETRGAPGLKESVWQLKSEALSG